MHPNNYRLMTAVLLTVVLVFNGCLGGPSKAPATRFFVLNSLYSEENTNRPEPVAVLDKSTLIGVGPIKLSQALDRPQIIMRTSQNEIRVADLERWAMPLRENILNVLVDNLTALLVTGSILKFPWKASIPLDYQIVMEITRFDGLPGDRVDLRARWGILTADGETVLLKRKLTLTNPVEGDTIAEMVTAQSQLVAKLSHAIAVEIKQLEEKKAKP